MSTDRGHILLMNHLHNPGTTLPLQTIQGALSHQLATLLSSPTPLAATVISSPFYLSQPINYAKLNSLSTAFRHSLQLKYRDLVESERKRSRFEGLFKQTVAGALDGWVKDIVKGLQGGHPVLRLASCSGLLLGLDDLKRPNKEFGDGVVLGGARRTTEDEGIVALAEVMDAYAFVSGGPTTVYGVEEWEKEFQPAGQDLLSLALIFASQSFPLISQSKLKVLPLAVLAQILTSTIATTFKNGTFLSSVSASVTLSSEHQVHISSSSAFAQTLESMTTSPLTAAISSVSRFTSNVFALLLEEDLSAASQCLRTIGDVAKNVERDWISTSLASVTDAGIAPDSKELAKSVWTILKTLLFTVIMVSDGALSASIFLSPTPGPQKPSTLALTTLHTLSHLSFVISQFGGVTSTGNGFEELKRTFYLSLDILAHDGEGKEAEEYVRQSCIAVRSQSNEGNVTFRQAKQAFTLASIEQLVPVLSDHCVRNWVWDICHSHLNDPSNRETFESAHSVILAIFASHAAQQQLQRGREEGAAEGGGGELRTMAASLSESRTFAWLDRVRRFGKLRSGQQRLLRERANTASGTEANAEMNAADQARVGEGRRLRSGRGLSTESVQRMVPFYVRCLIENSAEGRLNTPQLRMAYSALVRSASSCSTSAVTWSSTFPSASLSSVPSASLSSPSSVLVKPGDNDRKDSSLASWGAKQKREDGEDEQVLFSLDVKDDAASYALGWYCVQVLLDTLCEIGRVRLARGGGSGKEGEEDSNGGGPGKGKGKMQDIIGGSGGGIQIGEDIGLERVHRLNLTLVSTISSLPLALLPRVLTEIHSVVITGFPSGLNTGDLGTGRGQGEDNLDGEQKRQEVVEAFFQEILEGVGDREKEYAMRWWYEHRENLLGPGSEVGVSTRKSEKQDEEEKEGRARL